MSSRIRLWAAILAALAIPLATVVVPARPAHASVVPFTSRYQDSIYGDFVKTGNAVLGCPPGDARCESAQQRGDKSGNNSYDMQYVHADPSVGGYDSSVGRVTVPPGATVAFARLYWAANTGTARFNTLRNKCDISAASDAVKPTTGSPNQPVRMKVGGGGTSSVSPRMLEQDPDTEGGPHYYTAEGDVTSQLAAAPTGTPTNITVGDIWAPTGLGCIGGWSLSVVYRYPAPNAQYAPTRRNVYVYAGHVLQRSNAAPTTIDISGFRAADIGQVRAGVTAYEGDWNVPGSRFAINDQLIPEPGTGDKTKFFNSYADNTVDPNVPNNMSVDAKGFGVPASVIPPGSSSAKLTFSTSGDTYLPQELLFSVPVPDVVVSKKADRATAGPGDTVKYTITITNQGAAADPDAHVDDDLSDVIDDAHYNGDARADGGTVTYQAPKLTWHGPLPARTTRTMTYTATVGAPPAGNKVLRNVLVTPENAGMSCDVHEDQADSDCRSVVTIRNAPILAATGGQVGALAGGGAAALLLGAVVTLVARRRRRA